MSPLARGTSGAAQDRSPLGRGTSGVEGPVMQHPHSSMIPFHACRYKVAYQTARKSFDQENPMIKNR